VPTSKRKNDQHPRTSACDSEAPLQREGGAGVKFRPSKEKREMGGRSRKKKTRVRFRVTGLSKAGVLIQRKQSARSASAQEKKEDLRRRRKARGRLSKSRQSRRRCLSFRWRIDSLKKDILALQSGHEEIRSERNRRRGTKKTPRDLATMRKLRHERRNLVSGGILKRHC